MRLRSVSRKRRRDHRGMPSWMAYQMQTKRAAARRRLTRKAVRYVTSFVFVFILIYGITGEAVYHMDPAEQQAVAGGESKADPPLLAHQRTPETRPRIRREEIPGLLENRMFVNLKSPVFDVAHGKGTYRVQTTLDGDLQRYLLENLNRSYARYIAIVVMAPDTGRILAMVGYDRENPRNNPCLDSHFPAASIFKIVTAAAAVEKGGFTPDSTIAYSGRKYTLYKFQLEQPSKRATRKVSFKDSFAQSINPVFGKLGVHYLKRDVLKSYAEAFGFNRSFPFEAPIPPSEIAIKEVPYHWAEIASGFNRQTTISPLHGALIASAVENGGCLMTPILVDAIADAASHAVYQSAPSPIGRAVSPEASGILRGLMEETVATGTCRKTFRKADRDPVLSRLRIGGKTGSINSRDHSYRRYDWFVGFAGDREGGETIALSAIVVHDKFIGTKAREYARMAIRRHFDRYFSNNGPSGRDGKTDGVRETL